LAAVVNIAADPAPATQSGEYTAVSTTRWCANYPWFFWPTIIDKTHHYRCEHTSDTPPAKLWFLSIKSIQQQLFSSSI